MQTEDLQQAVKILQTGGLIAYPTEAVYGLGCDPFNRAAVSRLCALKKRDANAGFILIAANWKQIESLIETSKIPPEQMRKIQSTWLGPVTWVFPASEKGIV